MTTDDTLQPNQFRLSLLFCLVGLVASALTGRRLYLDVVANNNHVWTEFGLFLALPVVAALVLLLGRQSVAAPMAISILVMAAAACFVLVAKDTLAAHGWANLCLPVASEVSILWLLRERISVLRLGVAIANSFLLGAWLVAVLPR